MVKKAVIFLFLFCLLLALGACGTETENIVEDLKGPEGIELFAGLWYYEEQSVWIEVYYDGTWCSFEDGGMIRSYGKLDIDGQQADLKPTEGQDSYVFAASEGALLDAAGKSLFQVTEVGIVKPLIVNTLGVPDSIPSEERVQGQPDTTLAETYAGFYVSENGIYALELETDASYELQEYGMVIEKGQFLHLTEPDYGQSYAVAEESAEYRLILTQEERLYLHGCGAFAPVEKTELQEDPE
ncbi:MAG: hypothetical protein J6K89_01330 [Oscillospiraceae bacterium]|nr:hypothetical protein [Oscillospiraceae bacterium]